MARHRLPDVRVRAAWHQTARGCWSLTLGERGCRVRVLQREPGGVFVRRVWLAGRGWTQASLQTASRPEAEHRATAFLRAVLTDERREAHHPLTLEELWTRYEKEATAYHENTPRVRTEKAARAELLLLGLGADTPVATLTLEAVARYGALRRRGTGWPDGRATEPGAARTVAQDLSLLRTMLRWALTVREPDGRWLLAENPLRGLTLPVERNPKRPVATYERFQAVRAAVQQLAAEQPARRTVWLRLELALVLAEATGRRIGAIAKLRWGDVTQDPPAIAWRKEFDKRRREATVPVPAALMQEIVRFRARLGAFDEGWLFPLEVAPARPWHRKRFDTLLRQAQTRADVPPLVGGLWHPYRRKWATERRHLPPVDVMAAGGWKSRSVLESCYQQATSEAVLEVMASSAKLHERKSVGNS